MSPKIVVRKEHRTVQLRVSLRWQATVTCFFAQSRFVLFAAKRSDFVKEWLEVLRNRSSSGKLRRKWNPTLSFLGAIEAFGDCCAKRLFERVAQGLGVKTFVTS